MSPDWQRITALFEEALALDAAGRERLLQREASADPRVADELRALLRAHDTAGTFLESPVWKAAPDLIAGADSSDASLTGRRIGAYEVREEIGRGGMGVVYAAEDVRLGRLVALKMLPSAYGDDAVARERLAREARAAASFSHPRVATVYALEEIDGHLFIASEIVRGPTLRAELSAGPLAHDRLVDTVRQIADALEAAHAHGIVHRDLKPENVLRDPEGRIKVVDFGIARSLTPRPAGTEPLTVAGAALGTPGYMAPEQLRGTPVDARADVFAFGVMAYELATGVHPFGGSDPASLIERLVSDDPPLSRGIVPAPLDAIVRRCLRGDPAARFQSGAELAAALRALDGRQARQSLAQSAWWWQFHQVAVAVITIAAVIHISAHKDWIGRGGSAALLEALILATISTTLRLHMWFVSLVHPATLRALRDRVLKWVVLCESLFLVSLLAVAGVLAGVHDGMAAHLTVTGLLILISLIVIEPATTRASLD